MALHVTPANVDDRAEVGKLAAAKPRGLLTANQAAKVDAMKKDWPEFATMRRLAMRFRGMLKSENVSKLGAWLKDAQKSGDATVRAHGAERYRRGEECDQ